MWIMSAMHILKQLKKASADEIKDLRACISMYLKHKIYGNSLIYLQSFQLMISKYPLF